MPPINPAQLPKLIRAARQAEARGDLSGARAQYEAILTANPKSAEVQFQLGQLLMKSQDWAQAAEHLDRAADLRPQEKVIWQAYTHAIAHLDDPTRADALLKKAKRARIDRTLLLAMSERLRPSKKPGAVSYGDAPMAEVDTVLSLMRGSKYAQAAQKVDGLARRFPAIAPLQILLGKARASLDQNDAADRAFRKAISLEPTLVDSHADYGHFLTRKGRFEAAVPVLVAALKRDPKRVACLLDMGNAFRNMNRLKAAERALTQVLDIDPKENRARSELAQVYLSDNRPEDALAALEPVIKGKKPGALDLSVYARALAALEQSAEAERYFDKAMAAAPSLIQPISDKALFLQHSGRFEEAEALYLKMIKANPEIGQHYLSYLTTKKVAGDDPIIDQMVATFAREDLTPSSRSSLGFALAKALEDSKQYDRVFQYLKPANDIIRAHYSYDVAERSTLADALEAAYVQTDFAIDDQAVAAPGTPIFVTGLPRSGTTLVEQIVASHSRVTGGGELGYARAELGTLLRNPDESYRAWEQISAEERSAVTHRIYERMTGRFPDADLITDKSVQTYPLIGPVLSLVPGSKLVVVHRDPRATLLSIYKNKFADGMHLYSYDLEDLARYFHAFQRLIRFWREKLPGRFYEIRYEDLIAEPEAQTRALIAACGLDWEDGCLSFHENRRRVDTLSVHQVRQPIYTSSMNAWERYAQDLQPLFKALGPEYAESVESEDP